MQLKFKLYLNNKFFVLKTFHYVEKITKYIQSTEQYHNKIKFKIDLTTSVLQVHVIQLDLSGVHAWVNLRFMIVHVEFGRIFLPWSLQRQTKCGQQKKRFLSYFRLSLVFHNLQTKKVRLKRLYLGIESWFDGFKYRICQKYKRYLTRIS